ncbi:hypothetical protein QQ14_08105 [Salmonella enterica subsp. enterica]|nr:hypothetical protein [Salmonella enterica subsp. houtenae]EAA9528123.1 hypothetical protein [Salmonella enterica]ECH8279763.1 hypothetical protein [Salmonella enterica subsp. enterica]ECT3982089.1 hypothetical protein [Salmonella enterica subsp. houtenae serovar 53:z4,z23:-]EAA7681446.1 hypothetical protein [Salmonella enterica subsp. houtenae]
MYLFNRYLVQPCYVIILPAGRNRFWCSLPMNDYLAQIRTHQDIFSHRFYRESNWCKVLPFNPVIIDRFSYEIITAVIKTGGFLSIIKY